MRQRFHTVALALALVLVGIALSWSWSYSRHLWSDHTQLHTIIVIINELDRRDPSLVPTALRAAGLSPATAESAPVKPPVEEP